MKNKISIINITLILISFFIIYGWSFIPYPKYLQQNTGMLNNQYILMYNIASIIISISLISIVIPQIGNKKWMKILTILISTIVLLTNFGYLILSLISQKIFVNTSQKLWMINILIVNIIVGVLFVRIGMRWWKENERYESHLD
ncbi:MAG: hypothetical protein NXH86_13940 [Flavobacteriaceae bacterium]|uniref:hypothetical protein n=1 Tax=Flagellimonas sp. SN16 TaxID=3415142 RepID=UPI003C533225|nr:hypothetical protein [Flavobacteriaceae bacterium]